MCKTGKLAITLCPKEKLLNIAFDQHLVEEFIKILESPPPDGRQKEQVVQDFLEEHTELIPIPNRLNHHLHFEVVISKFPLTTELTTDYVYITKSSDVWRITFVELEVPEKPIYNSNTKKVNTSAKFNDALNQVRSWKHFIDENKNEVLRKLEPLLQPKGMKRNPIEFHYQLIIGRSENKNFTEARKKHFRGLIDETGIDILTYDTLLNWYRNDQRFLKNILRLSGVQYAFKYMHFEPTQIFSYVGPDYLTLTQEQIDHLKNSGYEMDKWKKGDLLTYNNKYASSTWKNELEEGKLFKPGEA